MINHRSIDSLFFLILLLGFLACTGNKERGKEGQSAATEDSSKHVVTVIAKDFRFEVADKILSGWTTFDFRNEGHAEHFFLLNHIPDTVSFEFYVKKVTQPFDIVFDSIKNGMSKQDAGALLGRLIPSWYFTDVKQMGGTGIVSPMKNTQTTLKLEPGNYIMECYIKEQGVFHTALGMISFINVLKESSKMSAPEANYQISLNNTELQTAGELHTGENTISVSFREHPDVGLGNDIHMFKFDENTDIETVINWLNWMNINGLEAPAPVKFLGGTQEMPAGYTAYFTVDLEPGDYTFIAESGASRGLLKKISIQ